MLRFAISATLTCVSMMFAGAPYGFGEEGDEHHEVGPHKGSLVELGDEEYHAEIVHDEKAETVTIYILGSDAKTAVATDAKDVVINAKVKGKATQLKLKASPQKGDKGSASSRFSAKSKELIKLLDDEKSEPVLRVAINGKTFNGKIEHDHEEGEEPAPKKK